LEPYIGALAKSFVGVAHSSEIAFVFDNPYNPSPSDQTVADTMNTYWATFAKTGNPNFPGAPATWPAFVPDANDNDKRLQLDKNWDVLTNFRKEECAFWRTYYVSP
jgi:carboxylesterase type B